MLATEQVHGLERQAVEITVERGSAVEIAAQLLRIQRIALHHIRYAQLNVYNCNARYGVPKPSLCSLNRHYVNLGR